MNLATSFQVDRHGRRQNDAFPWWRSTPLSLGLVAAALLLLSTAATAFAMQSGSATFELEAETRVYDETGSSLAPEETTALNRQLADLQSIGGDVIVFVRALDATPEETLDQVEALQQAWVAETGADQDIAVAILINRNPDDPNDARAGIYVGKTYNDGNVPEDEQRAIVDDALIPPLRDSDVYGSFSAGLERLESSIVNGPPESAFESWAENAGSSWVPWAGVAATIAGFGGAFSLFRQRQTIVRPNVLPTVARPGDLTPALGGALALGSPQASAVPATILDLAARNALDIEAESEGGTFSDPKVRIRLLNQSLVRDPVEALVWAEMERQAELGVISSKNLAKVATKNAPVRAEIKEQMRSAGWIDENAPSRKGGLLAIFIGAIVLAVGSFVVAIAGEVWWPAIGIAALVALALAAIFQYGAYSGLSREGQEAAMPWRAYREGLKNAAKDRTVVLDLNAVLADTVAMNLGSAMNDRLKEANERGVVLQAFASNRGLSNGNVRTAIFPWWIAFSSSASTASGAGSSTVSGGGAGGGGGAAGST